MEHAHTPVLAPKKTRLAFLSALVLVLVGSFITLDVIKLVTDLDFHIAGYLKVAASFFAALTAWSLGRSGFGGRDQLWLSLAFLFIFLGDFGNLAWTLVNPAHEAGWVSKIGFGLLFAQLFLIIRHAKGFKYLFDDAGHLILSRLLLPAVFYLVVFGAFAIGAPWFWQAGFFTAAVIHVIFMATSLWVGWAALVHNVYPRRNGWLVAVGTSFFFVMNLVTALYNLKDSLPADLRVISDIAWIMVWALYTPFLILLPYSGVDWDR